MTVQHQTSTEGLLAAIRVLHAIAPEGRGRDRRSRGDEQRKVDLGRWWRFVTGRSRSSRSNWREAAAREIQVDKRAVWMKQSKSNK